jgi:hypothetical protein
MGFEQEIRSSLAGQPQDPLRWFYVSFTDKSGAFMGAIVVQGSDRVEAVMDSVGLQPEGARMGTDIEIPDDKLPPEQYRSKWLTSAEVEEMWPEVKG